MTAYDFVLIRAATYAVRPWESKYTETYDRRTVRKADQAVIDRCLSCRKAECTNCLRSKKHTNQMEAASCR